MRTFKLFNSYGVVWDITTKESFFYDVSGLGYSREEEYRKAGSRYITVKSEIASPNIEGSVAFTGPSPYQQYKDFMIFIRSGQLQIAYAPLGETFYKQVSVESIGKSEISNELGILTCSISLKPLTPWFSIQAVYTRPSQVAHSFVWPTTWPVIFENSQPMSCTITSDSIEPSPAKLTIFGPVHDPIWRHYVNGVLKSTGKVTCNVLLGQKLVIDNCNIPYSICIFDSNDELVNNVYASSDFSTDRFLNLEYGTNLVTIASEAFEQTEVRLEGHLYYASV